MQPKRIVVVGSGYVGLTAGACLASIGHQVTCVDVDARKVDSLRCGEISIHEPDVGDLVKEGISSRRLSFELDVTRAVRTSEVVLLCLPTPMKGDGSADLSMVESVVSAIRHLLPSGCVLVTKSTVPVGTAARLSSLLQRPDVPVVSNPEFLREGRAVEDFLHPDRIVVGADDPAAAALVASLYMPLNATIMVTDAASAELVKYVSNCFLAMKLSYANAVSELCERLEADVVDVLRGMGMDTRIGAAFLRPGPGWGGSCLPKDAQALAWTAGAVGMDFPLLRAAIDVNKTQTTRMTEKVRAVVGGSLEGVKLGILGLTFKAGTDDLRESPALAIAGELVALGAELKAYDPLVRSGVDQVTLVGDAYAAARDTVALLVLTEWPEFRTLDWVHMSMLMERPVVIDTRNHLDPGDLAAAGLAWHGLGRRSVPGRRSGSASPARRERAGTGDEPVRSSG